MLRVRIKIPANFRSFQTGFVCPNCGHEVHETMESLRACHKTACPLCFQKIMVHMAKTQKKIRGSQVSTGDPVVESNR